MAFPVAPVNGTVWTSNAGIDYTYNAANGCWIISSSAGGLPASAQGILYDDGSGTRSWLSLTWTTATRPVSPVVGQRGYNSTLDDEELWNGTAWVPASVTQSTV